MDREIPETGWLELQEYGQSHCVDIQDGVFYSNYSYKQFNLKVLSMNCYLMEL
jgi:hypothetical protein